MGNGFSQGTPPVREGDEIDVVVEAVGEKGDGIAKVKGFVLFIPSVKKGDEIRVRITKVLAKVGFAEMIGAAQSKPAVAAPVAVRAPEPEPESVIEVDEKTGKETIKGEDFEAEYDPAMDSEDFGEE